MKTSDKGFKITPNPCHINTLSEGQGGHLSQGPRAKPPDGATLGNCGTDRSMVTTRQPKSRRLIRETGRWLITDFREEGRHTEASMISRMLFTVKGHSRPGPETGFYQPRKQEELAGTSVRRLCPSAVVGLRVSMSMPRLPRPRKHDFSRRRCGRHRHLPPARPACAGAGASGPQVGCAAWFLF